MTGTSNPRLLPTVKIHDTAFYVDVRLEEFRQSDDPHNRIPFKEMHETSTGHHTFFYDSKTKNVFRGTDEELKERSDIRFVKLPSLWDLDREGMNQLTQEYAAALREDRANKLAEQKNTTHQENSYPSKRKGKKH